MLIDFDTKMTGIDGKPMKNQTDESVDARARAKESGEKLPEPVLYDATLKDIALKALLNQLQGDQQQNGETKMKWGLLAQRIYAGGKVELKSEESALLKERIGRGFSVEVVLCASKALDG